MNQESKVPFNHIYHKDQMNLFGQKVVKQQNEVRKMKQETKEIKVVGAIDLPKFDVRQYEGMKVKVETVELKEGKHGPFYKVSSAVIAKIGKEENPVEIRATKILGLFENEDGDYGWPKEGKVADFLAKHDAVDPSELLDKELLIVVETKSGKDYLQLS